MSRPARFQHIETFERGRVVVHLLDTKSGRHHWIHRQGSQLLEWDRQDAPVSNGLLRSAARHALDEHQETLREAAGMPCRRCGEPFRPKGNAKTCGVCISEIGERNSRMAREVAA
jgi:hypothetical protein